MGYVWQYTITDLVWYAIGYFTHVNLTRAMERLMVCRRYRKIL